MRRSRQIQARQATKNRNRGKQECSVNFRHCRSSGEIRKRQTNRGIEKQAREIERGKEKELVVARMLGATATHIKISDAIAHTRTKPWNKILKRYVIILRKTNCHKQRFKIYFSIFTVDAKS